MSYSNLYNDIMSSNDVAVLVSDVFAAEEVALKVSAYGAVELNASVFNGSMFDGLSPKNILYDTGGVLVTSDISSAMLHGSVYFIEDSNKSFNLPTGDFFLLPRSKFENGEDRMKSLSVNDATTAYLTVFSAHNRRRYAAVNATEINLIRDFLEVSPVSVTAANSNVYSVDCSEKADIRFKNALDNWALLGITEITWTLADNSTDTFSESELTDLYNAMLQSRALRALALHQYATMLKAAIPQTTVSDVALSQWPL